MISPIALFIYNRPEHTKQTLASLAKNTLANQSTLYVFADGPKKDVNSKKVIKTREVVDSYKSKFKKVIINNQGTNIGLANSIITGVSKVLETHKTVIILEDDLVTHPSFLQFMNTMLQRYETEENIFSISGFSFDNQLLKIPTNYQFDVFFTSRPSSWGWATWKNKWNKVDWQVIDFDKFKKNSTEIKNFNQGGNDLYSMLEMQMQGLINSWAIRFAYHLFKNHGYCLYPVKPLVDNIGQDGSGEHSSKNKKYSNNLDYKFTQKMRLPDKVILNAEILNNFKKIYRTSSWDIFKGKIKRNLKKYLFND